ncbi:MAG: hypothetical protein E6Q58_02425 [Niabella sp.]|nr:MAG: hypothetical protein E6Q58_02425 [Niabella sp.]
MNELFYNKKSGQAALIIVMVTMAAILGIGASSATQSNINLRDTVYGVQSEQALSCAEGGAEKGIGKYSNSDNAISDDVDTFPTETLNASGDSNCTINVQVSNYPLGDGVVNIPFLGQNKSQQLDITRRLPNPRLADVTPQNNATFVDFAIYIYIKAEDRVYRQMYHCGSGTAPKDFETDCNNIQLKQIASVPQLEVGDVIRIRVLRNSASFSLNGFTSGGSTASVGYLIESEGTVGSVRRKATVIKFYRQLPAFFDEALVVFD